MTWGEEKADYFKLIAKGGVVTLASNGLKLKLKSGVFIPDKESFRLIEVAIKLITSLSSVSVIADLGTGTGLLAISLAREFKNKKVIATDISNNALKLAKENAELNFVKNIEFIKNKKKVWLNVSKSQEIDFIISNPPYVGDIEFNSPKFLADYPDFNFQPESAIRTYDQDGTMPYMSILKEAQKKKVKYILFRTNPKNIKKLVELFSREQSLRVKIIKNKPGNEKYIFITLPKEKDENNLRHHK